MYQDRDWTVRYCFKDRLHNTLNDSLALYLIWSSHTPSLPEDPPQQLPTMSGLFGSASSSSATNTTGDISKDVTLNNPPEDGISDLSFSSQSDHLAVASWDKKVRIYEINAQGGSEGKALYEHEGPVLSVCWSKARHLTFNFSRTQYTDQSHRTVRRSSLAVPTKPPGSSILAPAAPLRPKSPHTTPQSDAFVWSTSPAKPLPSS